jgi:branched-chain amino acid transport system permease protein
MEGQIIWSELLNMLPQVLVDGLTLGFMYAVVALGYTMVYGILEFINFAHGEIFMVGAFIGTEVLLTFEAAGSLEGMNPYVAFFITLVVAMVLTGSLGVGIERLAYKPLRGAPRLVPLISAIGVSFLLQDIVRFSEALYRDAFYLNSPILFKDSIQFALGSAPVIIQERAIINVIITIVMMVALTFFINRTKWGIAMRAVAQDQSTASLMTINVDRVIMLTFLIGSALGGATGVLYAQNYGTIDPYIGFIIGLKAFTAAVLGGIGNLRGAMLGGVLLGLLEALSGSYLGPLTGGAFGAEYKDVFAFSILILVLLFKPEGLLGEAVKEKV